MGVPQTYLFTAPDEDDDPFGSPIHHKTIVKGLKELNPLVWCFDEYPDDFCWPGKFSKSPGTTLWLGKPYWYWTNSPGDNLTEAQQTTKREGKKITAMPMGMVPEWTRVDEHGRVVVKGWRAIFEKCIKSNVASRAAIELKFNINLQPAGSHGACERCRKIGIITKGYGIDRACQMHQGIDKLVRGAKEDAAEGAEKGIFLT